MESIVTAWDVYWVMQLDGIVSALQIFGYGLIVISGFAGLMIAMHRDFIPSGTDDHKTAVKIHRKCYRSAVLGAVLVAISAILPTSKTAAAMILLPAITSDQVIEPAGVEARELYMLAKQALRNMVEKQAEPEPKKE